MLVRIAAVAALGGFLFGYDLGLIGGAMLGISRAFDITHTSTKELIVGAAKFGAFFGTFLGGMLMLRYGRRRAIAWESLFFVLGPLIMAAATGPAALIIGRLVVGLGVGASAIVVPAYLAEIAPAKQRGAIVQMYELMLTLGMLCAGLVDALLSATAGPSAWRWMVGLPVLPGAAMAVSLVVLPESPRWLVLRGQLDQALAVLQHVLAGSGSAQGASGSITTLEAAEDELLLLWSSVEQDKAAVLEQRRLLHQRRSYYMRASAGGSAAAAAAAAAAEWRGAQSGMESQHEAPGGVHPRQLQVELSYQQQQQQQQQLAGRPGTHYVPPTPEAAAAGAHLAAGASPSASRRTTFASDDGESEAATAAAVARGSRPRSPPWKQQGRRQGQLVKQDSQVEEQLLPTSSSSSSHHSRPAAAAAARQPAMETGQPNDEGAAGSSSSSGSSGSGLGAKAAAARASLASWWQQQQPWLLPSAANHPQGGAVAAEGTRTSIRGSSSGGQADPGREQTALHTLWAMLRDIYIVARGPERRAFAIAVTLAVFNQATASTSVINYAPEVLAAQLGIHEESNAILYPTVISLTKCIGVAIALTVVDDLGRRPLLIAGGVGCAVSLWGAAAALGGAHVSGFLAALSLFIFCFSLSWAGLYWVVVSEIFSMSAKSPATSAATSLLFLTGAITDLVFLSLVSALGRWAFVVFGLVGVCSSVYVWAAVPETAGKSFAEVQALLAGGPGNSSNGSSSRGPGRPPDHTPASHAVSSATAVDADPLHPQPVFSLEEHEHEQLLAGNVGSSAGATNGAFPHLQLHQAASPAAADGSSGVPAQSGVEQGYLQQVWQRQQQQLLTDTGKGLQLPLGADLASNPGRQQR